MSVRLSEAWIFVSHSVKDLEQVRRIRNEIESKGANPILFFLKQKVDDELLRTFLQNEIAARNFFILCDSANSRSSDYVQFEVGHVQALPHVRRTTIDLSLPWDQQARKIDNLLNYATVFLSYPHAERDRVMPYADFLKSEDYAVFDPATSISMGAPWQQAIQDAIVEAGSHGNMVLFLTQSSLQSRYVEAAFNFYVSLAGVAPSPRHPVLVALEPVNTLQLPLIMGQYQIIDATQAPFDVTCAQIKRLLSL